MNIKFPQINRNITAFVSALFYNGFAGIMILLVLLITLLSYHTQFFPENEEYTKLKIATYMFPPDYNRFSNLGIYFYNHGLAREAFATFQIAQSLYRNPTSDNQQVLGEQVSPFTLYQLLTQESQSLEKDLNYWKKVAMEKPNYRDAYLQTSTLAYKLGKTNEAQEFLEKALIIDPLYPYKEIFSGN